MKQQRISGKEAARVAEDMAKPGPIRVVAASEAQEAPGALVPSPGSELDRKMPPRVRKPLPRNDQWKAPTPDLEGHRQRLREALGNTLSDEFVDVILGKLVEALRPGLYDQLEEATLNAALATIDSMQPRSELQAVLAVQITRRRARPRIPQRARLAPSASIPSSTCASRPWSVPMWVSWIGLVV